jgi:cell division protein FtsA
MPPAKETVIAALDVGTSKVSAMIALVGPGAEPRVLGVGHHLCQGLNAGMVIDLNLTKTAIGEAMTKAEKHAGLEVQQAYVALTSGGLASEVAHVEVAIDGHQIERADIDRVLTEGRARIDPGRRTLLHAQPTCYSVDAALGIRDPEGFFGDRLGVDIHVITAEPGPIRNLSRCVAGAHLGIDAMVAAPLATGLACLTRQERDVGVACVEIGAGVTNIAVYVREMLVALASIPMGGADITADIVGTLMTPAHHAERLKTLYGTAVSAPSDAHEMLDVPPITDEVEDIPEVNRVSRAELSDIIRRRLGLIFDQVADTLNDVGFTGPSARHVVLTGGTAQLAGIREFAQTALMKSVRIGKPTGIRGIPEAISGPAFSTLVGMVLYAANEPDDARRTPAPAPAGAALPKNPIERMWRWLEATF